MNVKRVIFLNALPLNAFSRERFVLCVSKYDIYNARKLFDALRRSSIEIKNYIRHSATVEIINKFFELDLKPSSELYEYKPGDVLFIITLKQPIRGIDVTNVDPNDLVVFVVDDFTCFA